MRLGGLLLLLLPAAAPAQTVEELDFVRALLEEVQLLSFAKDVEHCGYLGRDPRGALVATEPFAGTIASCGSPWPEGMEVVASWHTHGDFAEGYINEIPSLADMQSDRSLGIDGWVATPGGRLWFVDTERMVTKQVCRQGCLPVAAGFVKAQAGEVAKGYDHHGLRLRMGL